MDTSLPPLRAVICRSMDEPELVEELHRFRRRLFIDTLGWDLHADGDLERDEFDTATTLHCVLLLEGAVVGGFRAIRCDEPYLALKIFPQLATVRDYPRRRDTWEISRFGVTADSRHRLLAGVNYGLMFHFGRKQRATSLVAIADLVYERYLRTLGIKTRRYGPPQVIGRDRFGRELKCVAGEIPLADQINPAVSELLSLADLVEIHDATIVRRPAAISA